MQPGAVPLWQSHRGSVQLRVCKIAIFWICNLSYLAVKFWLFMKFMLMSRAYSSSNEFFSMLGPKLSILEELNVKKSAWIPPHLDQKLKKRLNLKSISKQEKINQFIILYVTLYV